MSFQKQEVKIVPPAGHQDGREKSCGFFFCYHHLRTCPSKQTKCGISAAPPPPGPHRGMCDPPAPTLSLEEDGSLMVGFTLRGAPFLSNCVVLSNTQISNQNTRSST